MTHEVFISHSSLDKPVADAVCAALENIAIRCWIAASYPSACIDLCQANETVTLKNKARDMDCDSDNSLSLQYRDSLLPWVSPGTKPTCSIASSAASSNPSAAPAASFACQSSAVCGHSVLRQLPSRRCSAMGHWAGRHGIRRPGATFLPPNLRCHAPDRRSYPRKRAQGKKHEVAISHLMRILTRRLVAVLRSGKPYQSNYNLTLQSVA